MNGDGTRAVWASLFFTLAALLLGAGPGTALPPGEVVVHGEATLETPTPSVVAGELVPLSGKGFVPGEKHRLVLRGALDEHVLGAVTAGADSTFAVEMRVPAEAGGGQFRVVAVAPDGDEVATLDLALSPAPESEQPVRESAGEEGAGADSQPAETRGAARTDEVVIERSRAGVEWSVIGLLVGLAGGLGVGMLRKG